MFFLKKLKTILLLCIENGIFIMSQSKRDKLFGQILDLVVAYITEQGGTEGPRIQVKNNKNIPSLNNRTFMVGPAAALHEDGNMGLAVVELHDNPPSLQPQFVYNTSDVFAQNDLLGMAPMETCSMTANEGLELFRLLEAYLSNWKMEKDFPQFRTVSPTVH